jgi:uncharacterized protein YndB with AHSA1/START domain
MDLTRHTYSTLINAPKNVIWHVLWSDIFYPQWTKDFAEGSHAKSTWNQGDEILFLDGNQNGMYSIITHKEEPNTITFTHHGNIKEGKKTSPESWSGAMETLTLTEEENGTLLSIEHDVAEPWAEFFSTTMPKALALVKQISESKQAKIISIHTHIAAPIDMIWNAWVSPKHITLWNHASDDWHTPHAENHFHVGGNFTYTMAAKDGSFSFDFKGHYTRITENAYIAYTIADGRKVEVFFKTKGNLTEVQEIFEAEKVHPLAFQKQGWQQILNNFKQHVESLTTPV